MTSYSDYEKAVLRTLWTWADQHHEGELDGGKRQGCPPVLVGGAASKNVLVPSDRSNVDEIRAAIPRNPWYRWFRSLKSSQALAQSVFGALRAFNRLDLLQNYVCRVRAPGLL